jgi:hypothetical protein
MQSLPQGPYLDSCCSARMLEGTLVAFCDKGNGTWNTAELANADQCNGSVANLDGNLTCGTAPQTGATSAPQTYGSSYGTSGYQGYGIPPANQGAMTSPGTGTYAPNNQSYGPAQYQMYGPPTSPIYPAPATGTAPMVGSSQPPQYYGSSFGASGPSWGYSGAPANNPYTPPYATGAPGNPYGWTVVPAANGNQPIGSPGTPSNPS